MIYCGLTFRLLIKEHYNTHLSWRFYEIYVYECFTFKLIYLIVLCDILNTLDFQAIIERVCKHITCIIYALRPPKLAEAKYYVVHR